MYPSYPPQPPAVIKVGYKPMYPVIYIVCGSLLFALGIIMLLTGTLSLWVAIGPVLLAAGIVMRSVPFLSFEPGTGTLYLHGPFGNRVFTYGAPKRQRLYFDGANVMRVGADGKPKKIRTGSGEETGLQALHQALWAAQQPPTAPPTR